MQYNFSKLQNLAATGLISMSLALSACNGGGSGTTGTDSTSTDSTTGGSDANTLLGAGSTFFNPLFSKLFSVITTKQV